MDGYEFLGKDITTKADAIRLFDLVEAALHADLPPDLEGEVQQALERFNARFHANFFDCGEMAAEKQRTIQEMVEQIKGERELRKG